jgi:hypothetical protein
LGFALLVAVTVAIWWRNHDILSDLYDYSSVIVAAGKIEAGLKPYVDFRSTMQSSTYFLNRGVELVFGRNYLGLTVGGLGVVLAGAVTLFALWRRSFGTAGGLMLTAAVVWSGLSQHVVVFYNTVGILCLAIELAWRGATPALWFENVVVLAGERVSFWRFLADPGVYAAPAHDLHHNIPFKQLTPMGLGLLAVVGFQVWSLVRRNAAPGG